jgi:hypothetical protein
MFWDGDFADVLLNRDATNFKLMILIKLAVLYQIQIGSLI